MEIPFSDRKQIGQLQKKLAAARRVLDHLRDVHFVDVGEECSYCKSEAFDAAEDAAEGGRDLPVGWTLGADLVPYNGPGDGLDSSRSIRIETAEELTERLGTTDARFSAQPTKREGK